jgi:hypothetical protein
MKNSHVFSWFMPDRVNLDCVGFGLNVKNTSWRLPVDRFVADWTVDKKRAVFFNYQKALARLKS